MDDGERQDFLSRFEPRNVTFRAAAGEVQISRPKGRGEAMEKEPQITGAAILAIGKLTKDAKIARTIYEEAAKLARQQGTSRLGCKHVQEVALRFRRPRYKAPA